MKQAIRLCVVLFVMTGLILAHREARSLMAKPEKQPSASVGEALTDPPNRKVESPAQAATDGRQQSRLGGTLSPPRAPLRGYGSTLANSSPPPLWTRRSGKPPATPPTYLPRDSSVEPPRATFLPSVAKQAPPKSVPPQSLVSIPVRTGRTPDAVADDQYRVLLHHAQFLIKAGLSPIAKEPLQQIIREAPGTPIAREARATLDTISRS